MRQSEKKTVTRQGIRHHFREELAQFYRSKPPGFVVDHIHPLNGGNYSGLHVPWNLQYLTDSANASKRHSMPGEWISGELRQAGNVFRPAHKLRPIVAAKKKSRKDDRHSPGYMREYMRKHRSKSVT
jgi:hypothetical protein